MDSQITADSSDDTIGQNVVIHSAASDFSLPIRVVPGQTEMSQSSDIYNAEVQNSAEAKEGFTTSIVNKYSANRLGSTIWQCKICGKKATDIIHAATSTLSLLGSSTSDAVVPVCNSMNCVTQGRAMAEGLGRNESSSLEAMTCENCGNPSKMVLCAACRFTHVPRKSSCVRISGPPRQSRRNRGKEDTGASASGTQL